MIKFRWLTLALLLASVSACEKTKPATRAQAHKEGDGHQHKEGDGHDHKEGEHKEGDGHDHSKKE